MKVQPYVHKYVPGNPLCNGEEMLPLAPVHV